ncbi:MAG TPA: FlgD immunoglobulin-like domain containing protein, partial [Candidatus Cloacimonadota bacterium]|nr:FlgD immunoglobulin-like domain containing protein [Candidatus Cloacimonadota bacterium]HPT73184.1 FlgD immunoglobulin-like domain containing protein [Candidatus Cloacimonadota bacterium]
IPGYLGLSNSDFIEFSHITADLCNSNLYSFFSGENLDNLLFENVHVKGAVGTGIACMSLGNANMTMRNCSFNHIISNLTDWGSQAMFQFCMVDSIIIENTSFTNCESYNEGGGIVGLIAFNDTQTNLQPKIRVNNCLFANNFTQYNPTVSTFTYVDLQSEFNNCTFINNRANNLMPALILESDAIVRNSIFDNPTYREILFVDNYINGSDYRYQMLNNDVVGGVAATHENGDTGHVTWHEGNIFDNPAIVGGDLNDPLSYLLSSDSPCIDAGTPDTTGLFLPLADLAGNYRIWNNRIDMGCYEYGSAPVGTEDQLHTEVYSSLSNYPNPFNPSTTISYNLKDNAQVTLDIYNIRGQLVKSLVHEKQSSGKHSIVWNGRDESNTSCASGVYLYRLKAGEALITRKMILMK